MQEEERTMRGANEFDHLMRREEYFPARSVDKEDAYKAFAESEGERRGAGVLHRLTLPAKSLDEWPTLVGLQAVMGVPGVVRDIATVGSPFLDGLTIDQQITSVLPVIPVVIRTQNSET